MFEVENVNGLNWRPYLIRKTTSCRWRKSIYINAPECPEGHFRHFVKKQKVPLRLLMTILRIHWQNIYSLYLKLLINENENYFRGGRSKNVSSGHS